MGYYAVDGLASRDRLLNWGVAAISTCVLCNGAPEGHDHVFFCCLYSNKVWTFFLRNIRAQRTTVIVEQEVVGLCGQYGG